MRIEPSRKIPPLSAFTTPPLRLAVSVLFPDFAIFLVQLTQISTHPEVHGSKTANTLRPRPVWITEPSDVVSHYIGDELNVLAVPKKEPFPDRFLDHDSADVCTDKFRRLQIPELPDAPRHYVDDIYGILDGIEMGLGKGVIAAHLVKNNAHIRIIESLKPLRISVWLHHLKGAWETPLQKAVVAAIKTNAAQFLTAPVSSKRVKKNA